MTDPGSTQIDAAALTDAFWSWYHELGRHGDPKPMATPLASFRAGWDAALAAAADAEPTSDPQLAEFIDAARAVAVNGSNLCGHIDPKTLEDREVVGGVVVPEHLWERLHELHITVFFDDAVSVSPEPREEQE